MRILILRGGALGDFILMLPLLALLREQWPEAKIDWVGHPHLAEIAVGRFFLDHAFSANHRELTPFFIPNGKLPPAWESLLGSSNLVLSFFYDPDEIFFNNLKRCDPGRILSLSPKVSAHHRGHAAAYYAEIVKPFNLFLDSQHLRRGLLRFKEEDVSGASRFWADIESRLGLKEGGEVGNQGRLRWIAVHVGSGSETKNWPLDRWVEWCRRTSSQFPDVGWLWIEGEADGARVRAMEKSAEMYGWTHAVARQLPLPVLGEALKRASLYVGHDTGISHLAAASSSHLPVVTLFGPTEPEIWAPVGSEVHTLRRGPAWKISPWRT